MSFEGFSASKKRRVHGLFASAKLGGFSAFRREGFGTSRDILCEEGGIYLDRGGIASEKILVRIGNRVFSWFENIRCRVQLPRDLALVV